MKKAMSICPTNTTYGPHCVWGHQIYKKPKFLMNASSSLAAHSAGLLSKNSKSNNLERVHKHPEASNSNQLDE